MSKNKILKVKQITDFSKLSKSIKTLENEIKFLLSSKNTRFFNSKGLRKTEKLLKKYKKQYYKVGKAQGKIFDIFATKNTKGFKIGDTILNAYDSNEPYGKLIDIVTAKKALKKYYDAQLKEEVEEKEIPKNALLLVIKTFNPTPGGLYEIELCNLNDEQWKIK